MAMRPQWLVAALEHQRAGRLAEAERIYQGVLASNASEPDALHLLGLVAASRQNVELAGRLIAGALTANPNRADFYASLGNLFLARGLGAEMADCYRRALLLDYFSEIPMGFEKLAAYAGSTPPARSFATLEGQYRSQYLQDVLLDRWLFEGMQDGVFVDIGAHDGLTYSNSYFFETVRKWRGICIEPNPGVYAQLVQNRQCTNLNCCVADRTGTVPFLKISGYSEMLSGIVETYDPEHRQRVEEELKQYGGTKEVIPIPARRLNDIAAESGFGEINYLSIDTEGSELSILQSVDFKSLFVHVLTVEYNYAHVKTRMIALMQASGFDFAQTLGHDLLFLNRKSPFHAAFARLAGRA